MSEAVFQAHVIHCARENGFALLGRMGRTAAL